MEALFDAVTVLAAGAAWALAAAWRALRRRAERVGPVRVAAELLAACGLLAALST